MNWFIGLPMSMRMTILFVVGAIVGGQVNHAIYRLAWNPRPLGPWSPKHKDAAPRKWWHRIPIVGWFGLASEEKIHGTMYWLRPVLIEFFSAATFALLYEWEVNGGLHAWNYFKFPAPAAGIIHAEYLSHILLFGLMLAATFIDFDEKTIPDGITIPGTILGLILAALLPNSLLPAIRNIGTFVKPVASEPFLDFAIPFTWDPKWHGITGLIVAMACLIGWVIALLPRTIHFRQGFFKGLSYLFASIVRSARKLWMRVALLLLLTLGWTLLTWSWGGAAWQGLFSAIAGLGFAGALVWAFRVVASVVMQQEALGFGDVTLMAMIGTYIGWQASLLVFFIAPFTGLVVALIQYAFTRKSEIAYGPYLCAGTALLILNWNNIWERAGDYFSLGVLIPVALLICLVALAAMLSAWSWIKSRLLAGQGQA